MPHTSLQRRRVVSVNLVVKPEGSNQIRWYSTSRSKTQTYSSTGSTHGFCCHKPAPDDRAYCLWDNDLEGFVYLFHAHAYSGCTYAILYVHATRFNECDLLCVIHWSWQRLHLRYHLEMRNGNITYSLHATRRCYSLISLLASS
jgi:hypothetical protein